MNNFRILCQFNFWVKLFVISWWGIVVGSYIWFLGFIGKYPLFDGWLSVVTATLISGAGMNHITNLYNTPVAKFSVEFSWPVFFVSLGAVLLVAGAALGALHKELWAQVLSLIYVLIAVIAIVAGSDSSPKS